MRYLILFIGITVQVALAMSACLSVRPFLCPFESLSVCPYVLTSSSREL